MGFLVSLVVGFNGSGGGFGGLNGGGRMRVDGLVGWFFFFFFFN